MNGTEHRTADQALAAMERVEYGAHVGKITEADLLTLRAYIESTQKVQASLARWQEVLAPIAWKPRQFGGMFGITSYRCRQCDSTWFPGEPAVHKENCAYVAAHTVLFGEGQ